MNTHNNEINTMAKSNVIKFPTIAAPNLTINDGVGKLAVLTAYLGAKEGYTQDDIMVMMLGQINPKLLDELDLAPIVMQIGIGFYLWESNPDFSSQDIYNIVDYLASIGRTQAQ
jgi:hypothetical protein